MSVHLACAGAPRTLPDPPPTCRVDALGDSAVTLEARVWVLSKDYARYQAETIEGVKEAFDRGRIEVPYPHRMEIAKGEVGRREVVVRALPKNTDAREA